MKRLAFVIVVLGLSFVSCDSNEDINEEIYTEEFQSVDPDDDGTIQDEDRPRD